MLNYEQKVCRRFMSNVNLPNTAITGGTHLICAPTGKNINRRPVTEYFTEACSHALAYKCVRLWAPERAGENSPRTHLVSFLLMQQGAVVAEDVLAGNLRSQREQSERRHAIIPPRPPSAGHRPCIHSTSAHWPMGKYSPSVRKGGWDGRIYRKSGLALRHARRSNSAVERRRMRREKAWVRLWHHWAQVPCLVSNRDNHFFSIRFTQSYLIVPVHLLGESPLTRKHVASFRPAIKPLLFLEAKVICDTGHCKCFVKNTKKVTTEQKYIHVHFYLLTTLL